MLKSKHKDYQVSEENLYKVESFFVDRAKELGTNRIETTVAKIAEGSGVALATAHKAILQLEKDKVLEVIRPKSRRFAITYIYNRDIEDFDFELEQHSQIEHLQSLVQKQKEEIASLQEQLNNAQGMIRVLENKLNNA